MIITLPSRYIRFYSNTYFWWFAIGYLISYNILRQFPWTTHIRYPITDQYKVPGVVSRTTWCDSNTPAQVTDVYRKMGTVSITHKTTTCREIPQSLVKLDVKILMRVWCWTSASKAKLQWNMLCISNFRTTKRQETLNSITPSDAYMRQQTNHH